jgi:hypothetical protein
MTESLPKGPRRLPRLLPLALFILVAAFSVFMSYYYAYHVVDSDISSELVLGKFLADHRTIVSPDFFYSTEIRLFNTNLVYMPLFLITDNWQIVRFLSSVIFQLLLVASYYFLSRQAGISRRAFFLSAALMLLPINVHYGRYLLYFNHYTMTFIFSFLVIGLYLSMIRRRGEKRAGQIIRLVLMLGLSFASCMNGFRQSLAMLAPLLLTALLMMIKSAPSGTRALTGIPKDRYKHAGLAVLVCAAGTAGLIVHNKILTQHFSVMQQTEVAVEFLSVDYLRNLLEDYLHLFGFYENCTLFSVEGLLSLGGIFSAVAMLFVSSGTLLRKRRISGAGEKDFLSLFYPVAMFSMTVVFLFLTVKPAFLSYYFPAFAWMFPYLGLYFDREGFSLRTATLKRIAVWAACVCMFLNGVFWNLYALHPERTQVDWFKGPDIYYDAVERMEGVVDFIEENGLEVGYATFWNANIVSELTSGQATMIPIYRIYPDPAYGYHDWLTAKPFREESFVEDKEVFLLLEQEETWVFCDSELSMYAIPTYSDEYYQIYQFDFSTTVWEYLLEQAKIYRQTTVLEQLMPENNI